MTPSRKLPVGVQDFEDLRVNGYLYADKTAYVYRLASSGKPYFLGRPRRFGKSLFLSTLKAYFQGKKELFEGLAIAGLEKEWIEYPVVYVDFTLGDVARVDRLEGTLHLNLERTEKQLGINLEGETDPAKRFSKLIEQAREKTGRKVVVLVDEYDKPLLATMDNPALNDEIRTVLKAFYGVLKGSDANLRFAFLTGVTKFSKVSIFSDLNQLQDISMNKQFAGICGISESELVDNFQPELQALAEGTGKTYEETLAEMKKRYDGYHFAKESEDIYNPFSVLNTFARLDFGNYWFETGTPTFLIKMLQAVDFDVPQLENDVQIPANAIMDYRVDNPDPVPVLYQSGYLTIKSYDALLDEYTLGLPNEEVKYGFFRELLMVYMPGKNINREFFAGSFTRDLWAHDVNGFMTRLKAFFSGIPYELNNKQEKHYQTVFYALFTLIGQFIQVEYRTATGRADAVVQTSDAVFVFEFKMEANATAEDALRQIDERGYLAPFAASGKQLVKIGVEFGGEERGVKRWVVA
ncbi:MAG: ATP-binding protein [Odoribacteraceae bacterium]|jgi:hypothetical protein|nr:ATP-binding protein [Odoribacteraceae bacterium]